MTACANMGSDKMTIVHDARRAVLLQTLMMVAMVASASMVSEMMSTAIHVSIAVKFTLQNSIRLQGQNTTRFRANQFWLSQLGEFHHHHHHHLMMRYRRIPRCHLVGMKQQIHQGHHITSMTMARPSGTVLSSLSTSGRFGQCLLRFRREEQQVCSLIMGRTVLPNGAIAVSRAAAHRPACAR